MVDVSFGAADVVVALFVIVVVICVGDDFDFY